MSLVLVSTFAGFVSSCSIFGSTKYVTSPKSPRPSWSRGDGQGRRPRGGAALSPPTRPSLCFPLERLYNMSLLMQFLQAAPNASALTGSSTGREHAIPFQGSRVRASPLAVSPWIFKRRRGGILQGPRLLFHLALLVNGRGYVYTYSRERAPLVCARLTRALAGTR